MAMDIGANFKITAAVAGQAAVDRLSASLRGTSDNASGLASSFGALKGVIAGLGLAGVALSFVQSARAAINNADALSDMAARTGIAGARLSELQFAAQMNGTSLNDVEVALKKVSTRAFEAATGSKSAAATFDALGISVRDSSGQLKASDVLMQEIADVLNTVQDRTTRTALAVEIFGKSGADMIPLLENMRSATQEAQRLGIVIGEDMQKSANEFNDNVDRMTFMARAFATSLANEVMPTLNRFMTEMMAGRQIFGSYWEALKNIGLTNPFKSAGENAEKYKQKLSELEAEFRKIENVGTRAAANRRKELKEEIEDTRKLVEYFQRMSGAGAPAAAPAAGAAAKKPMDGRALLDRLRSANEAAVAPAKQNEFESLKRGYEDALARVQELTEAEKLLRNIQLGRYKDLSPNQKRQLEDLARELDAKQALAEKEKQDRARQSNFDNLKRGYEDALVRVEDLSEAEKLLREIQLGRYSELSPNQKKQLEDLARELDIKRRIAENEKAAEEQQRRAAEQREAAARREQDEIDRAIDRYKDLADPVAKYRQELEQVRSLFDRGLIDEATFSGAVAAINDSIDKVKDGQDEFKKLTAAINGWGRQATDAFVNFAFNAKSSFSDMINSMLKDLARMVIQENVMGPLFSAIGATVKASSFGSFAARFTSGAGGAFANGGIMTSAGPLPLNAYAGGGIANSPQVALFGEGRMPEAYVPLPDGRSIPVSLKGGSGGGAVNVNVIVNAQTGQTEKGDAGMFGKLGASIAGVVRQEIINQKRPGGLLAT